MLDSLVGTLLDGRYNIISKLGAGAMAVVFLANDVKEDRQVAIKVLPSPSGEEAKQLLKRFEREFRSCSRLDHPSIIKLYSFGTIADSYYYAMEYVDGPDLREELDFHGNFDDKKGFDFVDQMARAFKHYHASSIVHRDLKPTNIMVYDNRYIITDFGLARDLARTQMTQTGTVIGSPLYMSPELATGRKADHRSDIFQLGAITYEALTGKCPFDGTSLQEVLGKIVAYDPPPVTDHNPMLSKGWNVLLDRCMEKEPIDRYQNGADILFDLEKLREGNLTVSRRTAPIKRSRAAEPITEEDLERPTRPQKVRRRSSAPPFKETKSAPPSNRKYLPFAALCIPLLLLLLHLFWGSGPENYSSQQVKVTPAVTSATITWTSAIPYKSKVKLLTNGSPTFVDDRFAGTKEHRVIIEGLEPSRQYKVRIVYPSGEMSLPKQFATKELAINVQSAMWQGDRLELEWSANVDGPWQLQVREGEGRPLFSKAEIIKEGEKTKYRAAIDVQRERAQSLLLELPKGFAGKEALSLALRSWLIARSEELKRPFASFDVKELIHDVTLKLAPDADKLIDDLDKGKPNIAEEKRIAVVKGRRARVLIEERLARAGVLRAEEQVRKIANLLLGGPFLNGQQKAALYSQVQKVHRYYFAARFNESAISYEYNPIPGDFDLSITPLAGDVEEIELYSRPEGEFYKMGIQNSLFIDMMENKMELTMNATVKDLSNVEAAEIRLRTIANYRLIVLLMQVNSMPKITVPDIRNWHEKFKGHERSTLLCQRIPVDVLKEGRNSIVFETDALYRAITRSVIKINRVTLALKRRSR